MQFSVVGKLPENVAAKLFVYTQAEQLNDAVARVLADSLQEKSSFAQADILENDQLHPIAVLRLENLATADLQKALREAAAWAQKQTQVGLDLTPFCVENAPRIAAQWVAALGAAVYRFDYFKSEPKPAKIQESLLVTSFANEVNAAIDEAQSLLYGVNLCKDLANMAPNVCTPTYLAETAAEKARSLGAEAEILGKDYIQENMPSFWGVAKGSVQEPKLLILKHQGAANAEEAPIVLVGKGLTFDSGGISLKPAANMDEMKYDMGGAASVIGAFMAAVKAKLPINLMTVVATCENMPDGGASKPGDIVKTMKGITVENLNTDAEGRLVLCDALEYVKRFNPQFVIDAATLTGACVIALGHVSCGVMSNHQALADLLLAASRESNDKAWQLPLFDEYREQLKSPFADIANVGGRDAGVITAGAFLSHFTEDYAWAHLDIAGTAWLSGANKGATGRPVPLLFQFLKNQAQAV